MIFDLFHSISDPVIGGARLGEKKAVENYIQQAKLAEELGFDTLWLAESHFSSETQKQTSVATIPNFHGEVGLNCDSYQFFHFLISQTKKIGLGTGIHNIVGGSGGPISSAERVNFMSFLNDNYWGRTLRMGVASGRFPYQNTPFGIVPRNETELDFWPSISRMIFLEALEIFLRLLRGETLKTNQLTSYEIKESDLEFYGDKAGALKEKYSFPVKVKPRWVFEALSLVPHQEVSRNLRVVLGSSDPRALEIGLKFWDLDLFNLSFTPPEKIDALHSKMTDLSEKSGRKWHRSRLPRTVLTFMDKDSKKAHRLASDVIDTYIEAMRGTAHVPDKAVLLERALIGDASEVRDQLSPDNPRKFHTDDRLMLWFEFNQNDNQAICNQMTYFADKVASHLT